MEFITTGFSASTCAFNFSRTDLPAALQLAPIFSFAAINNNTSFLAAGNFYGVMPYEGRYDALYPTIFVQNTKKTGYDIQGILPTIDGEARDIKWINYNDNKKILVMASNNNPLIFLTPNK